MIDDGKIEVIVDAIMPNGDVKVKVKLGGIISSKKGLNLPDTKISLPALTEKDLVDLDFIIKEKLEEANSKIKVVLEERQKNLDIKIAGGGAAAAGAKKK